MDTPELWVRGFEREIINSPPPSEMIDKIINEIIKRGRVPPVLAIRVAFAPPHDLSSRRPRDGLAARPVADIPDGASRRVPSTRLHSMLGHAAGAASPDAAGAASPAAAASPDAAGAASTAAATSTAAAGAASTAAALAHILIPHVVICAGWAHLAQGLLRDTRFCA